MILCKVALSGQSIPAAAAMRLFLVTVAALLCLTGVHGKLRRSRMQLNQSRPAVEGRAAPVRVANTATPADHRVSGLPGQPAGFNNTQYAGFINVDAVNNGTYFHGPGRSAAADGARLAPTARARSQVTSSTGSSSTRRPPRCRW
jgi:hypothetical protein